MACIEFRRGSFAGLDSSAVMVIRMIRDREAIGEVESAKIFPLTCSRADSPELERCGSFEAFLALAAAIFPRPVNS